MYPIMKRINTKILIISLILLVILSSCNENSTKSHSELNTSEREVSLVPIRYDYENLKLELNSSISDSVSDEFWRWDYMNSDNGGPDSTGVDYYMNYDQASFFFNGEETLPALYIKTNRNIIIQFSATIIFNLPDHTPKSINSLLDSLITFDLLQDPKVRQSIIDCGSYKNINSDFKETIELLISEEEYGYDRITYSIKTSLIWSIQ